MQHLLASYFSSTENNERQKFPLTQTLGREAIYYCKIWFKAWFEYPNETWRFRGIKMITSQKSKLINRIGRRRERRKNGTKKRQCDESTVDVRKRQKIIQDIAYTAALRLL